MTIFKFSLLFTTGMLVTAVFSGCDLLNKPETDIGDKIDAAVDYANAPVINVAVVTGNGGVAAPLGTTKQGYPFSVNFTPFADYGFLGWKAYRNMVVEGEELGPQAVAFNGINDPNTSVTIKINPGNGKIVLLASGTDRPRVVYTYPSASENVINNSYIRILFSRPIDRSSFYYDLNGGIQTDGAGNFKNIHITERGNETRILDKYFTSPYLSPDGLSLILWLKLERYAEDEYWEGVHSLLYRDSAYYNGEGITRLEVTLDRSIRDLNGIEMGQKNSLAYSIKLNGMCNLDLPYISSQWRVIKEDQVILGNWQNIILSAFNNSALSQVYRDIHGFSNPDPAGGNWIYFVFQVERAKRGNDYELGSWPERIPEVTDLPVMGVRVFESRLNHSDPNQTNSTEVVFTEDVPFFTQDPVLAAKIASKLSENNPGLFNPDLPFYIAKYQLKKRPGFPTTGGTNLWQGNRWVSVYFYPLTPLDTVDGLEPSLLRERILEAGFVNELSYFNTNTAINAALKAGAGSDPVRSSYGDATTRGINIFYGDHTQ